MKRCLTAALLSLCLTGPGRAQEAVPLTYDLFDIVWTVIDFEGKPEVVSAVPMIGFSETQAQGSLQCGGYWQADAALDDLPRYVITNPVGPAVRPVCDDMAAEDAFLTALAQVVRVDTTPEGLAFFAADGRRVVLAVAGG